MSFTQKHLFNLLNWSAAEIQQTIDLAIELKTEWKDQGPKMHLQGKNVALYFEKPSLRTITTFQMGIMQMGGGAVVLDPKSIGLGKREPVEDVARCLGRWTDGLVVRCFEQQLVEQLGKWSEKPTINALTDDFHPCQALAFGQLMQEHFGSLKGKKVVFVGDGNNVANSLAVLAAKLGMHFVLTCPPGYEQDQKFISSLDSLFKQSGGSYQQESDPHNAVKNADILYGDVWASMGQESEQVERVKIFQPFQINEALLESAGKQAHITHCLPAHRGEEITAGIMDSPKNICFDEAENRLHAQKAVLFNLLK